MNLIKTAIDLTVDTIAFLLMDEIKTIDRSEVYDITAQIRELMLEEQIAMKDVQALKAIAESRARVVKAMKEKTRQFHSRKFG